MRPSSSDENRGTPHPPKAAGRAKSAGAKPGYVYLHSAIDGFSRLALAEEVLYAREFASEHHRFAAISVWNIHYNYHRPHSGAAGLPPASRLQVGVTNVQSLYT